MIHSSNASASSIAASSSVASFALLTPTDDPMFAGFTKHGSPSSAITRVGEPRTVGSVAQREVVGLREPARRERALHHHLVHPDRRAEDTRADVRQAREVEQPLDRPVLAVGTVEQREDDVHLQPAGPGMGHGAAERVELCAFDVERGREPRGITGDQLACGIVRAATALPG